MSGSARCTMVVRSATKPRFGRQNVMLQVAGDEDAGIVRGTFTLDAEVSDGSAGFERGDEFVVTIVPAGDFAGDEEPQPDVNEDEAGEVSPDNDAGDAPTSGEVGGDNGEPPEAEAEIPPLPDVKVSELADHLKSVDNPTVLEAWRAQDERTTATPIYDARLAELEAGE